MNPAEHETLKVVRGYAAAGRIRVTEHARARMRQRGATFADVRSALADATGCGASGPEKWKITGPDLDGDDLTCAVALEGGVVVVTVS